MLSKSIPIAVPSSSLWSICRQHAFLRGRTRITFADVQAEVLPAIRFKFARKLRVSRELGIKSNDALIQQTVAGVPITGR